MWLCVSASAHVCVCNSVYNFIFISNKKKNKKYIRKRYIQGCLTVCVRFCRVHSTLGFLGHSHEALAGRDEGPKSIGPARGAREAVRLGNDEGTNLLSNVFVREDCLLLVGRVFRLSPVTVLRFMIQSRGSRCTVPRTSVNVV